MNKPEINYSSHTHCQTCSLSELCLPFTLNEQELERLDSMIKRKRPIQKGKLLFSAGQKAESLYAVRSGMLKTFSTSQQGYDIVTGFHIAGDVLGFDAVSEGNHKVFAQAIETSMICEIPLPTLDELSGEMPAFKRQLMRLMSNEITEMQERLQFLNRKNAEERLAAFLYTHGRRLAARGQSATEFMLVMPRGDIGSYIDIRIETISRLLGHFQREGILKVDGKFISILKPEELSVIGGCQG